jgi:hypothetical protein
MKSRIKIWLGELPFTAEAYWYLRQRGKPTGGFSYKRLQEALPIWRDEANEILRTHRPKSGKRVLIFATLRYWIEHAAILGLALSGLGHKVTLAYLPYANWDKFLSQFDLRRQNVYTRDVLNLASPLLDVTSFFNQKPLPLPDGLKVDIESAALQDTQYTHQVEEVNRNSKLYRLRLKRNTQAAQAALSWIADNKPDVVVLPSGSIVEFSAVYHSARYCDIPVVSYEFGEQRQRIWFSLKSQVMRQNTNEMWAAYQNDDLTPEKLERIQVLYASRQKAHLWGNFSRRWQDTPSEGGERIRQILGLDSRPIALLAANVIGDSLTLGRQVFTDTMTEWLTRTAQEFALRPQVQLVVRIHPGERYTTGPSVFEIISKVLTSYPKPPENIHLVAADASINTYDLIEIADFGLVYTTTTGLEMALSGVPAIVVGQTHYRGRGFTLDPGSWDDYTEILNNLLTGLDRHRLSSEQVDRAWCYAYHFFFDYPQPFPWHLWYFWDDVKEWPMRRVLSNEGMALFGETFEYLLGEPRKWIY